VQCMDAQIAMQNTKCLEVQAQGQPSKGGGGLLHVHVSSQHGRHCLLSKQPIIGHDGQRQLLYPQVGTTPVLVLQQPRLLLSCTNSTSKNGVLCCVVLICEPPSCRVCSWWL
jgi:hypothetical protein